MLKGCIGLRFNIYLWFKISTMKKFVNITLFMLLAVTSSFAGTPNAPKEKTVTLTVSYEFKGIVDGYDHENKTELYVDGQLVATSTVKKESEKNSVSAVVSKGKHDIKVINYALYEGVWEEHTIANNYSQDCKYETSINVTKKKSKIKLLFDIDNGTKLVK